MDRAIRLSPSGQPLAAVEADLDVKGEPGLDAGVHEPEARMQEVLVEVKTLAWNEPETPLAAILGAVILEAHARLDRREGADEPLLHRVLGQELPRQILLAGLAGPQIDLRPTELSDINQRGRLELLGRTPDVLFEIQEPYAGALEAMEHAKLANQQQERPSEDQPVEPRQNGGDLRPESCYE